MSRVIPRAECKGTKMHLHGGKCRIHFRKRFSITVLAVRGLLEVSFQERIELAAATRYLLVLIKGTASHQCDFCSSKIIRF